MSDDITTRLRQTRANMIGTEDEDHYWHCHDAAAEIERIRSAHLATVDLFHAEITRLHGVTDRLRAEIERLRSMAFNPVTLTDAEREAIEVAARFMDKWGGVPNTIASDTLRGLLERLATADETTPADGIASPLHPLVRRAKVMAKKTVSRARMKAVIEAAKKRSLGDSLLSQYALYVITQCLKSDVQCDIEDDDGDCLTEMKRALNSFLLRQSRARFAYEHFIKQETDKSVDEAREYVEMVLEVLEQHEDGKGETEDVE